MTEEYKPKVGEVCEGAPSGFAFERLTILFISEKTVVVRTGRFEAAYQIDDIKFRPIRSERDIGIAQMEEDVCLYMENGALCRKGNFRAEPSHIYRMFYDAGYRKQ